MSNVVTFDSAGAERVERQYSAPSLVEQRRRTLEALALQPGECVLDIGCGPGYLTAEMAQRVGGTGRVTGIDTSEAMLDLARRRCATYGNVALECADAVRLPCQDASVDVAAAVQVYLFVRELEAALGELARVLRPGGRAVIVDTDWDSLVWHASDASRMQRMLDTFTQRYVNARVARLFPGLLRRAGLRIEHASAIPIVELVPAAESYSGSQLAELARFVVGKNRITAEEAAAWANDQHELAERGAYFFALNRYLFLVRRPA